MRQLVIGDIHGYSSVLDGLLEMMAPERNDQVITLGDYVDKGPDSAGVLDRLIQLQTHCRLVALLGNHDQMMRDARDAPWNEAIWRRLGGEVALESYGPADRQGTIDDVPAAHWDFLDRCLTWHETATHFFVHANVFPDLPLGEQTERVLLWEKLLNPRPHCSGKIMVCGHTPQKSGLPLYRNRTICLDTWIYGDGWLTGLDVGTGQFWQANTRGERRTGKLAESESRSLS